MVLMVCAAGTAATPDSGRADARQFVRAYIEAHNTADPMAIMDMVSKRPEVTTATMGAITRGWEAIRAETESLARTQGTHRMSLGTMEVVLMGTAYAMAVAPLTVDLATEQGDARMRGAITLILEKAGGKWTVIHEHSSLQFPQIDVE
jgi:uncharacterized protein (TIGR02246 family)